MQLEIQVALSFLTMLGAGVSVYVAVRVALAEIKTIQKQHEDELKDLAERIKYLERRSHT
jgi:hypothetical protein